MNRKFLFNTGPAVLLRMLFFSVLISLPAAAQTRADSVGADYRIAPNDLLDVRTFNDPDGTAKVRVSRKGEIKHPYMGLVKIAGLTEAQASKKLEGALKDGYLVNPSVSITVLTFSKMVFVVRGAVNAPGSYQVPANTKLTLVQAIGEAKDFTDVANQKAVIVTRIVNGKPKRWKVNVKELAESLSGSAFYIKDGDVITVKESFL